MPRPAWQALVLTLPIAPTPETTGSMGVMHRALEEFDGFAPLDDTGAQPLFRFVAAAYERRSLGIGSHRPLESWGRVLPEHPTATKRTAPASGSPDPGRFLLVTLDLRGRRGNTISSGSLDCETEPPCALDQRGRAFPAQSRLAVGQSSRSDVFSRQHMAASRQGGHRPPARSVWPAGTAAAVPALARPQPVLRTTSRQPKTLTPPGPTNSPTMMSRAPKRT